MALPKDQKFPILAGTKVKIRTWEDMEKECGLDDGKDIKTPCCFSKRMRHLAGTIITLSGDITNWECAGRGRYDYWAISAEMIDYVLPCRQTVEGKPEDDFNLLRYYLQQQQKGGTMNPIIAEIFKNDKTSDAMLVNKHFQIGRAGDQIKLWAIILTPHKDELLKAAKEMEEEEKKNA